MIHCRLLTLLLTTCFVSSVYANTTLVDDDFESYATDNDLYSLWVPPNGNDDGILTSDDTLFPEIQGQGVDHLGGSVMQHTALSPSNTIFPTAAQNIEIQGDIYVGNDGNSRTSIGIRNSTTVTNLIELGTWNSNGQTTDPLSADDTTGVQEVTTYAYRLILMDDQGEALFRNPNWQFFQFDTALDVDDSDPLTEEPTPDGIVSPIDIGAGWHTYTAIIAENTVTLEMDLYRDGLDNGASITAGSDVPGVDASITWDVSAATSGFDSFRIGSPSNVTSANGVAFDNVSLKLVDVVTGGGSDVDTDGDVDGDDFLALQRDNPGGIAQWQSDYPLTPSLSASTVPEPTCLTILISAAVGSLAARRR